MRVAVAMSGGIDSSMSAVLLREAGHEVIGIHAIMHSYAHTPLSESGLISAQAIADRYSFRLLEISAEKEFNERIVLPFCQTYCEGKTPNPCVHCNHLIKAGLLLDEARRYGCDALATGHYARISRTDEGRFFVARGQEYDKDQSYFLYMLTQEQLRFLILPLSGYRKEDVRRMAVERGISVAARSESQDVCFIPDGRYVDFIERMVSRIPPPGDIEDANGNVVGRHRGIHRYTIGQRRGIGIASPHPLYVKTIDPLRNTITVGKREELNRCGLLAEDIRYMKATSLDGLSVLLKTRSTQHPFRAHLKETSSGVSAFFDEPQTSITPGQAAVFYNEQMEVLGGGTISRAIPCGEIDPRMEDAGGNVL